LNRNDVVVFTELITSRRVSHTEDQYKKKENVRMKFALITAAAVLLGIGSAAAATDHPNFHKGNPPGFSQGNKTGWGTGKHREPPGWDRGEKQGWNGNRPPGLQAKKGDYHRSKY
jgi:hypothetical protein